jgi:hypothetical protein
LKASARLGESFALRMPWSVKLASTTYVIIVPLPGSPALLVYVLRVCLETSGWIAEFSEHEAD